MIAVPGLAEFRFPELSLTLPDLSVSRSSATNAFVSDTVAVCDVTSAPSVPAGIAGVPKVNTGSTVLDDEVFVEPAPRVQAKSAAVSVSAASPPGSVIVTVNASAPGDEPDLGDATPTTDT